MYNLFYYDEKRDDWIFWLKSNDLVWIEDYIKSNNLLRPKIAWEIIGW